MKGALIIIGTFFREGIYLENRKETPDSFNTQKTATDSHIRFAEKFNMDIHIYAYPSKWESTLRKWYHNSTLNIHTQIYSELRTLLYNSTINEIKHDYDYIFIIRTDMFLKDTLFDIFEPTWNRIMFPSICFTASIEGALSDCHIMRFGPENQIEPRVNDVMLFIPKKYYHINKYWVDKHSSWVKYKYLYNLNDSDMGFMLDTYHDADSHKDYNPLYYLVGRKEKPYTVSGNKKIPAYYRLHQTPSDDMQERLAPTNIVVKMGFW